MSILYRGGEALAQDYNNSTTIVPQLPTGFQNDDFCVIAGRVGIAGATFTTPAGWTVIDTGQNASGGYSYCFYYRVLQSGDQNPTLTANVNSLWSWATAAVYSSIGSPIALLTASDTFNSSSSGTSVTPNAADSSNTAGAADLLLTVARATTSQAYSTFTFTPPSGWTQDSNALDFGNTGDSSGKNQRFAGICYQLGLSAGTVTPGSESLTDNLSQVFYFTTTHVVVQETIGQVNDPASALPSPAWENYYRASKKKSSVLWDFRPAFAASYSSSGDLTFGAVTTGQQILLITDPLNAQPGPAWANVFRAYSGKHQVLSDVQPVFNSRPTGNITFGATSFGQPILFIDDPDTVLPGKPFLNIFRYAVTSSKAQVLYDYRAAFAGTYFNPGVPSDITFGAITTAVVEFFDLPSLPAALPPAFQNAFKGQYRKLTILYDSPPNRQEIAFGPFCLGGTQTDTNLYGGTATDPNTGMGGTETDTNLYGASFTGCHI